MGWSVARLGRPYTGFRSRGMHSKQIANPAPATTFKNPGAAPRFLLQGEEGAAGYDRMRHSATSWKRETSRYALIFTPTMAQEGDAANAAR